MGSNRVIPVSASTTQTHTPSGLSSSPIPVLDMSSLIKTEPSTHLDGAMNAYCHSENWTESYQDLSSWCSTTSARSPATCKTPVTDETIVTEIADFQGEIDFDLRKSEEIASIPLEEDNSFILWGAGSPLLGENSPPAPSVSVVPSTEESSAVLLKDCWWSEVESGKVVKELESSKPQNLTASTSPCVKNPYYQEPISAVVVKEEVIDTKENMNPTVAPQPQTQLQPFLSDPIKMAELQMRFERIASIAQPGGDSKSKAADLMKLLQGQIVALNEKKYRSPAAISDLHNQQPKVHAESSVNASEIQLNFSQPSVAGNTEDIFQLDPFDGLFSGAESHLQAARPLVSQIASPLMSHQNATIAPSLIQNTSHTSPGKVIPGGAGNIVPHNSNLFFEAHHKILKEAPKPPQLAFHLMPQHQPVAQLPAQPVIQSVAELPLQRQFSGPQQASHQVHSSINEPVPNHPQRSASGITMQRPRVGLIMPELDANFDALLFGSPGTLAGVGKMQPILSTPEVLKPLVDTPELENFDLLSYLCDDKAATLPVGLDSSNPFRFPQVSTTQSTLASISTSSAAPELKSNVMVVKPMSTALEKEEKVLKTESAVVVEVKPQIRPVVLSDVEEEEMVEAEREPTIPARSIKEDRIPSRPSRSSRKRKYSEEEFDLTPSPSEETRPSRRRRTTSSKYDSDEDFTVPSRKSPKKSLSISGEEDDTKVKRPRSGMKRSERSISTSSESDRYRELRDRNNEASRKSRLTRKAREMELGKQADVLTRENKVLKVKVEEMENLVKKLREALLQSMMNKKT